MYPQQVAEAARELVARRKAGRVGERLPSEHRPHTLVDALQLQDAVSQLWCDDMDDTIGGWKCLQPPADKIIIGPIYTRTIDSVAPVALWPQDGQAVIEPELAFFFACDLPARAGPYSPAEVDAAIVRTHMALELIFNRYGPSAGCEFAETLGDGLVNQGLFIGPEVDSALAANKGEIAISLQVAGEAEQVLAGKHPNGNPRAPLYWLVEFLRSQGKGISAGQAVITGSYAGVLRVPLNTPVHIGYAGLGEMDVSFTAR